MSISYDEIVVGGEPFEVEFHDDWDTQLSDFDADAYSPDDDGHVFFVGVVVKHASGMENALWGVDVDVRWDDPLRYARECAYELGYESLRAVRLLPLALLPFAGGAR